MEDSHYPGGELELFAHARNWKQYYADRIRSYLNGDVLEVGAGIGATTSVLCSGREHSWTCIEPDPDLARQLASAVRQLAGPTIPTVSECAITDLPSSPAFDCILYIDVLEHIEDDRGELRQAAERLRPGGYVIVLSPAHSFLFSEFDRQIGHFRRYNTKTLRAVGPASTRLRDVFYLDSFGIMLSLANRLLLRTGSPSRKQIAFWDRFVVPGSRILDPMLGYRVGKTIIAVWQRTP
ncbi:MAG: class I SAM-dependent methyltransferase [Myxococcales bacterium]|jgi:SAM-dependent methyltransferase|nr:MAG: class I SAM-dependent methyltransferase [Myxococcales bacterium]